MKAWLKQKMKPKLHPPIKGWVQDLPEPNDPVGHMSMPSKMRINAINDTYLEVPRSEPLSRFAWAWAVFWFVPFAAHSAYMLFSLFLGKKEGSFQPFDYLVLGGGGLVFLVLLVSVSLYFYLLLRYVPRDESLRFNRLTQKVYACGCVFRAFPPRIERRYRECDWGDLRAEEYKNRAVIPTSAGGVIALSETRAILSIVDPDTNRVLERLEPSFREPNMSVIWEAIRRYMQQGQQAIPSEIRKVADPNASRNPFMRLARPVTWPDDIDFLSRSAPGKPARAPDYALIERAAATSERWQRVFYAIVIGLSVALVWGTSMLFPLW